MAAQHGDWRTSCYHKQRYFTRRDARLAVYRLRRVSEDATEAPIQHYRCRLCSAACGVPVHVVAERLGDDPATVLRTYAHLWASTQREAAARFDELLEA